MAEGTLLLARGCRGRVPCWFWCSRETRQAAVQLVLLCVASCSWTLLLISLTLTTSASTPRRPLKAAVETGPKWAEGGSEACQECLSRRGPPNSYWLVFERSLYQIASTLDRLDQPLAPAALRTHLRAARTLFRRLASVLHLPLIDSGGGDQSPRVINQEVLLSGPGTVDRRLACPEQFLGSRAGYPRYHKGYITLNCSSLPLKDVVTVILWDIEKENLPNLLSEFKHVYPGLPILLVSDEKVEGETNVIVEKPKPSTVAAITRLLDLVKTPYVFLGTNIVQMNNYSRLERLIWVAEWSGVWAVGGAGKGQDGRWRADCLQVTEGGGQLMYSRGYTTSLFECQLCHALQGPLVIRTPTLQKLGWPKSGTSIQLLMPRMFLDIHARAKPHQHGAAVCPDSMFLVESIDPPWDATEKPRRNEQELRQVAALWHTTAKQRRLARLHLPSGFTVNYPCDFLLSSHPSHASHFSPSAGDRSIPATWACQKRELSIIISHLFDACSKLQVKCYLRGSAAQALLNGGSLQDAVNKTLSFRTNSTVRLHSLQRILEPAHYVSSIEGHALVIEGHWWTVNVVSYNQANSAQWTSVEVVDGVWVPAIQPQSIAWTSTGESCAVFTFRVDDRSQIERMASLSTPHCSHNHLSDMTLGSP